MRQSYEDPLTDNYAASIKMKSRDMPISLHGYPTVSIRTAFL